MDLLETDKIRHLLNNLKGRVWKNYSGWLHFQGWSYDRVQEWLHDVCVDGILAAQAKIDKWDPERGDLHYWCYLHARTCARDSLRRANHYKAIRSDLIQEARERAQAYDPIDGMLERWEVGEVLDCLNSAQKEVMSLYYLYGLEVPKIARIVKCAPKTVYATLDRARKKLRAHSLELVAQGKLPPRPEGAGSPRQSEAVEQHDIRPPPTNIRTSPPPLSDLPL